MREKIRNTIIWLVLLLIIGITCFLIGYNISDKNKDKCKEEPKVEEKPKEEKEVEKILSPYLDLIVGCTSPDLFYFKKITTYKDLDPTIAIDIALRNYPPESQTNSVDDEYPDIETKDIEESIKHTFGKDKTIKFPKKLEFDSNFTSYILKDDKYVLAGQGGGCTGLYDYIIHKVVDSKEEGDKLIVQVNFALVTHDVALDEELEDLEDAPIIVYNSLSKKRVVAKDFYYGDEDKLEEVLNGNETDYIKFTFKLEEEHYIFEKAEIIER